MFSVVDVACLSSSVRLTLLLCLLHKCPAVKLSYFIYILLFFFFFCQETQKSRLVGV